MARIQMGKHLSRLGLIDDVADELCDLRESYIEPAIAEQKCEAEWELGAEYEYFISPCLQ